MSATTTVQVDHDYTTAQTRQAIVRLEKTLEEINDSGVTADTVCMRDLVVRSIEEFILIQEYRRTTNESIRKKAQSLLNKDSSTNK